MQLAVLAALVSGGSRQHSQTQRRAAMSMTSRLVGQAGSGTGQQARHQLRNDAACSRRAIRTEMGSLALRKSAEYLRRCRALPSLSLTLR